MAQGCRWRTILKTEGTVFVYMDRPRVANNVFIFFYGIAVKGPKTRGLYSGSKWENLDPGACMVYRQGDSGI